MGFSSGNNNNKVFADINVTPLVDVMLVLLIIFMITAPLMLNGVQLELPKTKEVNRVNLTTQQVVLSLTKNGSFYLGQDPITKEKMIELVNQKFKQTKTSVLFLRADYELSYGKVAKLMSYLKNGGISSIALVTEVDEKK
ncbi:MAG: ExbD/TolR family protein [Bacteriovoracaceae bacterium]